MALLPLFLQLAGRKVVLVGAGRVALQKLRSLDAVGADVTVVAPAALPEFEGRHPALVARPFVPSDLDGAWLAVAAATREVNREVAAAAEARRVFVNVVDDPEAASAS
jgi:uroporphyrin-III C-methyltransferase/precorrin-2 dehydrogenase/sirohydrochlorin ferrochelatase